MPRFLFSGNQKIAPKINFKKCSTISVFFVCFLYFTFFSFCAVSSYLRENSNDPDLNFHAKNNQHFQKFSAISNFIFFSFCLFFEIFAYLREISNDSNLNFCAKNQYYLKSGPQFPHFQRFHHNILFFWRNFRVISNDTFVGSGIRIDICQFFDIRCFSRPAQWK